MAKSISSSSTSERDRTVCRQPAISAAISEIRFFLSCRCFRSEKSFCNGKMDLPGKYKKPTCASVFYFYGFLYLLTWYYVVESIPLAFSQVF